jgi:hypothetical protein
MISRLICKSISIANCGQFQRVDPGDDLRDFPLQPELLGVSRTIP